MVVTTMHYELCTMNYALYPSPTQLHNSPHFHISTFLYFHVFTFPLLYIIIFMYNNINVGIILPFITHVYIYMVIKIGFWVHVFTYKIK